MKTGFEIHGFEIPSVSHTNPRLLTPPQLPAQVKEPEYDGMIKPHMVRSVLGKAGFNKNRGKSDTTLSHWAPPFVDAL